MNYIHMGHDYRSQKCCSGFKPAIDKWCLFHEHLQCFAWTFMGIHIYCYGLFTTELVEMDCWEEGKVSSEWAG